jgi:hypothetical protein
VPTTRTYLADGTAEQGGRLLARAPRGDSTSAAPAAAIAQQSEEGSSQNGH